MLLKGDREVELAVHSLAISATLNQSNSTTVAQSRVERFTNRATRERFEYERNLSSVNIELEFKNIKLVGRSRVRLYIFFILIVKLYIYP